MISAAMDAAGTKGTAGFFTKSVTERTVQTSGGADASEKRSQLHLSIRAFNTPDESGHSVSCSCTVNGFDPPSAGRTAGEIARNGKDPVQGNPGKYDVLFYPMAIGNIISRVGEFSTAFNVDTGFSCFTGKTGSRVASDAVSLIDKGNLDGGFNSSMFDDEGVPTRETRIVGNGKLLTYLHNTSSAKKYKKAKFIPKISWRDFNDIAKKMKFKCSNE